MVKFSVYLNRHFFRNSVGAHLHADLELCWSDVFFDARRYLASVKLLPLSWLIQQTINELRMFFFSSNFPQKTRSFMQVVSNGDNLHEMLKHLLNFFT